MLFCKLIIKTIVKIQKFIIVYCIIHIESQKLFIHKKVLRSDLHKQKKAHLIE